MSLSDYTAMQERCSNCSYCKWIPFDKVKSSRFAENCPSVCYYGYNTYSARGRFQLGLAIERGELDYSGTTADIVKNCLSCGACDVSCKICRYNLEPLEHTLALKADAIEKGAVTEKERELLECLKNERTMLPGRKRTGRGIWAKGLGLKDALREPAEVLYFPGCKYSYEESLIPTTRRFAKILLSLGVDLGWLGEADGCCGGRAWQMGFVSAFEKNAEFRREDIERSGVKAIVTPCADCYHTLKRQYARLGMEIEVYHAVEYLDKLLAEGKLTFKKRMELTVTYHDPCHLGRLGEEYVPWQGEEKKILNQVHIWSPPRPRYNGAHGIYDAPRRILQAIEGVKLVEMERIREYSWCCGAGGGCSETEPEFSAWTAGERVTEALATGAQALVTACPWCQSNLSGEQGEDGRSLPVIDLLDIVAQALEVE